MTVFRVSALRLVLWRKFGPLGDSSRCLSPSAKDPWQSGQPADLQVSRPSFTRASFWAHPGPAAPAITANAKDAAVSNLDRVSIVVSKLDVRFIIILGQCGEFEVPILSQQIRSGTSNSKAARV